MVYYCECGVNFTNEFGDIDEPFYNSVESMYQSTLDFLKTHPKLEKQFMARLENIVKNTQHIGWGFPDALEESFKAYHGTK